MAQTLLALAEQVDGVFRKVTFEALTLGRRIADDMGGTVSVLVLGSGIEASAETLKEYGADRIITADDPSLEHFRVDAYSQVVSDVTAAEKPAVIVMGASVRGKELAGRLSARIGASLAVDAVRVRWEDGRLIAVRPMYGGKILADVLLEGPRRLVAVRPNSIPVETRAGAGTLVRQPVDGVKTALTFIKKELDTEKVELTEADVIVSGGRGVGGSDFSALEQLADVLGGAVGASRSAVDEGWRPHSDQVGQTGKTVSPNLYIACGISGAVQHLAGMSSSKTVVAINKDPDAPIFSKADYGVVGDVHEMIPLITDEIKKIKE